MDARVAHELATIKMGALSKATGTVTYMHLSPALKNGSC